MAPTQKKIENQLLQKIEELDETHSTRTLQKAIQNVSQEIQHW